MKFGIMIAALCATTAAHAADVTPSYDWSGMYVGIQAGGRWAKEDLYLHTYSAQTDFVNKPSGGLIGGYMGYNHQINKFILGFEVGAALNSVSDIWSIWPLEYKSSAEQLVSVNARLGYAFDRTLVYGTAGYAHAKYKFQVMPGYFDRPRPPVKTKRNGWNIGAGIDYAVTDNIIARAEYRYYDFGTHGAEYSGGRFSNKQQTAVLGLAYKF